MSSIGRPRAEAAFGNHGGRVQVVREVLREPPLDVFEGEDGAEGLRDLLREAAEALEMELVLLGHVNAETYTTVAYYTSAERAAIAAGDTIPIGETYCREEITARVPFVLGDALLEPRFRDHPGLTKHGLRSYVGAPIVLADGTLFGTLCGVDARPHAVRLPAVDRLVRLAEAVGRRLSERLGVGAPRTV